MIIFQAQMGRKSGLEKRLRNLEKKFDDLNRDPEEPEEQIQEIPKKAVDNPYYEFYKPDAI